MRAGCGVFNICNHSISTVSVVISCRLMKKVALTYVANNINIIILYIVAEAILYDEVVTKTTNMSVNFRVWNNDDEVVKAAWVLDAENVQVSDKC